MTICNTCGQNYDSIQHVVCPNCMGQTFQQTIPPSAAPKNIVPMPPTAPVATNPVDDMFKDYEMPRVDILCPNCHTKNKRKDQFCVNCLEPLPTHSYQRESRSRVKSMIRCMDHVARRTYFMVMLRLYLIKYISSQMNVDLLIPSPCQGMLPNRQPCNQILTVMDDDCPTCGTPHLRYECGRCRFLVSTKDLRCPNCGEATYLSVLNDILNGGRIADMEEMISDLEGTFQVKLTKDTLSSMLPQKTILQSKLVLEQIAGDVAEICKTLAKYLRDSMEKSSIMSMGDSFRDIDGQWGDDGASFMGVQSQIPDQNLVDFIQNRAASNPESSDETDDSDSTSTPASSPSDPSEDDTDDGDFEDDGGDPTSAFTI